MTEIPVDRTAERIDIDVRDRIIIRAGTAGSDYEKLTGNRSLEALGIEKITNSEILNLLEGGEK